MFSKVDSVRQNLIWRSDLSLVTLETEYIVTFMRMRTICLWISHHLLPTKKDLLKLQKSVDEWIIVELGARERSSTKWRCSVARNVTVFAARLKNIPVIYGDVPLPFHLVKRTNVN